MSGGFTMTLYKTARKMYLRKIPILPELILRLNRVLNSIDLPYTAKIGDSTMFNHNGLGCVIHERAVIGKNCLIQQNVTIGGRGKSGVPTIGNNVFIGAGACVLGGITIGDHAQIGANAVVLKDVPPRSTAVGVPAKIILTESKTEAL